MCRRDCHTSSRISLNVTIAAPIATGAAIGTLIYSMNVSLDGYVEDANGSIDFTEPDDDLHRHWNRQTQEAAAFLFGRRLFEMMEGHWPTAESRGADAQAEFARAYVGTPRIVFSDSLRSVPEGVRLVRSRDALTEVRRLKQETDGHLDLGGPGLAASLLDLVDEFRLCVLPVVVGGGKPFFPASPSQLRLRLSEHHVFASGAVYLRYRRAH
ncbi:MAG: dihydrofolate reductase family protein [Nocardioidaceae bacterium]